MTFKRIVICFVILFFFISFSFCDTEEITEEIIFPVISLPVSIPVQTEKKIEKKIFFSKKTSSSKIKWEIDKQRGIQTISKIPNTKIFTGVGSKETILPINNYRTMMLTVFTPDLYIFHSDFTLGFLKENTPFDLSIENTPFVYADCISTETNIYITKELFLSDKVYIYPFAGYVFSEYYLQKFSDATSIPNFRLQALTTGLLTTYKPIRLINFDYTLSFSPISLMDYTDLVFFQLNYKVGFRLNTKILQFSIIFATKSNITYSFDSLGKDSIQVSEIGFKLKITL